MSLPDPVIVGDATLYFDDAYAILPQLGAMDECVSDPQYLFDTSGGGKFRKDRPNMDRIAADGLDQGFDVTAITPEQFASVRLFCHQDQLHVLLPHLAANWRTHVVCNWHKSNPLPVANKNYQPDSEPWVHAWGSEAEPVSGHPVGSLKQKARYWIGPNGKQTEYDHPTVKPIDLMRFIMRTVQGEVVCDPFMGTGTTGAAALIHGKRFVGIERDPRYFDMAVKRIRRVYADGLAGRGLWG